MIGNGVLAQRRSGILAPVTALPPTGLGQQRRHGDLDGAQRFIHWLAATGTGIWQLLPLGIPHDHRSPYLALSAHAGDPALIGRQWRRAQQRAELNSDYDDFCNTRCDWLDDFALFMALREEFDEAAWVDWPPPLRDREASALSAAQQRCAARLDEIKFDQFLFFRQWQEIRRCAHDNGVVLFGDMPLFVAHDSADVWAERHQFELGDHGHPLVVAGVPPDHFSATGQRWGNPHYRWPAHRADGFRWWRARLATQLQFYDVLRIDHFRGLRAAWRIPAANATAEQGEWCEAPGADLLAALHEAFPELPLIAEDLGLITPEVTALRKQFSLPGMAVLQFAFDSGADNPYLPHNLERDCVLYTGTHDNNTTLGWFQELAAEQRERVTRYLRCRDDDMPRAMAATALASVAQWAVIPLQDILGLGAEHRLNTPGTIQGNWRWRFHWDQLTPQISDGLRQWNEIYGRINN